VARPARPPFALGTGVEDGRDHRLQGTDHDAQDDAVDDYAQQSRQKPPYGILAGSRRTAAPPACGVMFIMCRR